MSNKPTILVWILGLKFVSIIVLVSYFVFSMAHGNDFNIVNWSSKAIYSFVTLILIVCMLQAAAIAYFDDSQVDNWIRKKTDFEIYSNSTVLDAVLAHYTNVATIGLFLGVLIFFSKNYLSAYPKLIAVLVPIFVFSVFVLYSILYAKLAFRFSRKGTFNAPVYFLLTVLVFFVDAVALDMLINAVPEPKSE